MYNKQFLEQLMEQRSRVIYARIISLNFDEQPIEQIEGKVTSGSISIDGASAVRRTCSLSMISEEPLTSYFWTLNTKFKLAIGVENTINNKYPNIIWFEQGLFLITAFSASQNINSYSINISGKDKMCLLNGEIGGTLPFSVDFGTIEQEISKDENEEVLYAKIKYHIKDIIREAVHTYGNEPFHNIIINDIEEYGLELEEYRYDKPLFIWRDINDTVFTQATLYAETITVFWNGESYMMSDLEEYGFIFDPLISDQKISKDKIKFNKDDEKEYYLAKIDYGETAGYKEIPLTYPDELILKPGDTLTQLLDKIKNFLGDFEYFYNLEGQFIFQKKKTYLNTPWNPINNEGEINFSLQEQDQYSYIFNSTDKFTAINQNPAISNLKNDFVVWGKNKSDNPIHMRYAIHKKPFIYTSITVTEEDLTAYNKKYGVNVQPQESQTYILDRGQIDKTSYAYDQESHTLIFENVSSQEYQKSLTINLESDFEQYKSYNEEKEEVSISLKDEIAVSDWREIIYQMSQDYIKYNHLDDFEVRVINANRSNEKYFFKKNDDTSLYCTYFTGKTGYEQYYIDMDGFWRQIYDPNSGPNYYEYIIPLNKKIKEGQMSDAEIKQLIYQVEHYNEDDIIYYTFDEEKEEFVADVRFGWSRLFIDAPSNLLFWIDFLDFQGELENFSVPAIGMRTKVVNDDKVKAIYYLDTPDIIFYQKAEDLDNEEITPNNSAYRYFQVPNIEEMFSRSTQGKTAKEEIDNLLYNHGYCSEAITLTSVPIYYLEPNTRIFVNDGANIIGDYIINKITIPLQYNGTMNITANKAPKRLY